jgi:hypothetical protein
MDLTTVLTRNPDAAYRIYDGQATVVLPDQAEVSVINPIGSLVWDRLDGARTLGDILTLIVEEFDVTPEQARADLFAFIDSLREHRMVR